MDSFSLINDDMIITLPFASRYWVGFKDGSAKCFEMNKSYYPLCQKALNLDHQTLPPEILNHISLADLSFIIADFDKPYSFMSNLRKCQDNTQNLGRITNPLVTFNYINNQEEIKLSAARKINLIKLCNLLQSELDYATLSLTIKNDEIMNRLSISSKSLKTALDMMKELGLINIENRSFKHFSLPQRIHFKDRFFKVIIGLSDSKLREVHLDAIEYINKMILIEYLDFDKTKRFDNEHYLAIGGLLESYGSIINKRNLEEITTKDTIKKITDKIAEVSSSFIERKKTLEHNTLIKNENSNLVVKPYEKEDILKAYDSVEIAMQRTKEKVKNLALNPNINTPGVMKAIANLL